MMKEKIEKAETKEEAKKIIEEAGLEMTDEDLDQVAGGLPDPLWLLNNTPGSGEFR